jgi:hypothetical protein
MRRLSVSFITVRGRVRHRQSVPAMARFHKSMYYMFAGSKENVASTAKLLLLGVDNGTAAVIGENKTVPLTTRSIFIASIASGWNLTLGALS